ncbi:hypothetical protein C3Y94_026135 [Rhizobium ruizarguesonis]|uniref:hypothetical protein n=1 Tax=Rhizobium ruizarguesonis TaxID=2081791 RepID=UPI00163B1F1A|nr:hypothetical protein [Rhizobium ruizarguesonis]MBC2806635.1 hypothetical protein [Rhizobium ruizarguesonis]
MKLWMVLYVGTHIGGTWGPLPYGLAECQTRAKAQNVQLEQSKKDPATIEKLKAAGRSIENWKFACEASAFRPQLGAL